jgi:hypothetical protein
MSTIADRAVLDSPLFKLPPELRNIIYEYAVETEPRVASKRVSVTANDRRAIDLFASYNVQEPPLLHNCRIIRREALGFFLAKPSHKVDLRVVRRREVSLSLGFWEHEASSVFSKHSSERDKVTSTLRHPHNAVWEGVTRWLREAEEFLDRGGDVSRVARRFHTVSYYGLMIVYGHVHTVGCRKSIDSGPASSFFRGHSQSGAVARA